MKSNLKIINFEDVKLQRLIIPAGWYVFLNKFYHIDPDTSLILKNHPLEFGIFEAFFENSLFGAENKSRQKFIDLGWYPMWEEDGTYRLEVHNLIEKQYKVKKRESSYTPSESIFSFSSRDREKTVIVLEKVLFQLAVGKPINL